MSIPYPDCMIFKYMCYYVLVLLRLAPSTLGIERNLFSQNALKRRRKLAKGCSFHVGYFLPRLECSYRSVSTLAPLVPPSDFPSAAWFRQLSLKACGMGESAT